MLPLAFRVDANTKCFLDNLRHPYATLMLEFNMSDQKSDVLQGTLDLMVLQTLDSMGPLHGYGIARRIEQVADGVLSLNQGTIYPALLRLQQKAWIKSEWGVSDNNRKAKYYALTANGRKQLAEETANWKRTVDIMARLIEPAR